MKKMLLAVTLAFAATAAQADIVSGGLRLTNGTGDFNGTPLTQALVAKDIVPSPGDDGWGGNDTTLQPAGLYTSGNYGMLVANQDTSVRFTFLGKVAGFDNINAWANGSVLNDIDVGASYTVEGIAAGQRLRFGFQTLTEGFNQTIVNGQANTAQIGILYLDASAWNKLYGTSFDFLIGYNDPANVNADYDDMVIGVQAVPVPAALPLMASALGMFGVARRRKTLA